eukprot:9484199-Pyramimonas_sp.AAC.1
MVLPGEQHLHRRGQGLLLVRRVVDAGRHPSDRRRYRRARVRGPRPGRASGSLWRRRRRDRPRLGRGRLHALVPLRGLPDGRVLDGLLQVLDHLAMIRDLVLQLVGCILELLDLLPRLLELILVLHGASARVRQLMTQRLERAQRVKDHADLGTLGLVRLGGLDVGNR